MKKFIIIILSILVAIAIGFDIYLVYRHHHPKEPPHLDIIPYEHFTIPQEHIETELSKAEIRTMLDSLYNIKYTYREIEEREQLEWGYTHDGVIEIVNYISPIDYVHVLAHEMTHIKYGTSNETFTEFKTITTLYESNNILFQKVALNRAKFIISGGLAHDERDCGYYLLEYFNWSKND